MAVTTYVQGVDLSRWQNKPDFGKLAAGGVEFVIIKATENLAVDRDFDYNRKAAAAAGWPTAAYAFLRPSDTNGTVDNFLNVTQGLVPALDWEAPGVMPAVVERWIDRCEAKLGRQGLAYYGQWPPVGQPTPKIASWPRWYPQYPGSATAPPHLPAWDGVSAPRWDHEWAIWQWTDKGTFSGLPGTFDMNRLAPGLTLERYANWVKTGSFGGPPARPVLRLTSPLTVSEDVGTLQTALNAHGAVLIVDRYFGPATARAVRAFKVGVGLPNDDVVDATVWAKLGL